MIKTNPTNLIQLYNEYTTILSDLQNALDPVASSRGGSKLVNMKQIDKKVLGRCVYVSYPSHKQYVKNKNEWIQLAEFRKLKQRKGKETN